MVEVTVVAFVPSARAAGSRIAIPRSRNGARFVLPLVAVAVLVIALVTVSGAGLPGFPAFTVLVMAFVGCFDLISVVLLVGQFRDSGRLRSLALSSAYLVSLLVLTGWAAAFPGALSATGPLARAASTAPWLWVAWHTLFPVLLALALCRWPTAWDREVPLARRRQVAWAGVLAATAVGIGVVAVLVPLSAVLPPIISGVDTSAMTRVAGPVMLPLVTAGTAVTVVGAWRRTGPERWAGLAATATLGDVVLTLVSEHRYSLGWYTGRGLTIVSAGVVLTAMIARFRHIRRELAADRRRLARLLEQTGQLERLQHTLLGHMSEGVLMHDAAGRVLASNPAAQRLLGLSADELHGRTAMDPRWAAVHSDGRKWDATERPSQRTVRTHRGRHKEVIGVRIESGALRWLSVNTTPVPHPDGHVEYVVSTLVDITAEHAATLADRQHAQARVERVQAVLKAGGPAMVIQPIVELATGRLAGVEALARFPDLPQQTPDRWFADAAAAGLGVELEIAAIRRALDLLEHLPPHVYLSMNASPATVTSPALAELLAGAPADRLVLELTEHVQVHDYTALAPALNRLRWSGVRLAVDDAGSGFASLQHILNLAPDIIKLDAALVRGADTDPARSSLAASLAMFADRIGAVVIAEGIETAAEAETMRRLSVRYGQGYYLGRPGPAHGLRGTAVPQRPSVPSPLPALPASAL